MTCGCTRCAPLASSLPVAVDEGRAHLALVCSSSLSAPRLRRSCCYSGTSMRSNWALGALPSLDSIGLSLTLCEPRSPTVQLHPVTLPEQVIITITAWEDCIRCATTARRRPFFRFPNLPGEPLSSSSPALRDSVNDVRTEIPTLGYMPAGLVLCIAAIANLSVDMDALPDAVVKAKRPRSSKPCAAGARFRRSTASKAQRSSSRHRRARCGDMCAPALPARLARRPR